MGGPEGRGVNKRDEGWGPAEGMWAGGGRRGRCVRGEGRLVGREKAGAKWGRGGWFWAGGAGRRAGCAGGKGRSWVVME